MNDMAHLGGYYEEGDGHTFTPDIWGWLLLEYGVESVIDIGCGTAVNLKWFQDMGCRVLGVEGHPDAILKAKCGPVVLHDYTKGSLEIDHRFDLCISTEFVEHVDAKYEANWFTSMRCADRVLMCHAVPGQGGHHHVNEQPAEYWVERFGQHGFRNLVVESAMFQDSTRRKPAPWGRNTLMLFEKVA